MELSKIAASIIVAALGVITYVVTKKFTDKHWKFTIAASVLVIVVTIIVDNIPECSLPQDSNKIYQIDKVVGNVTGKVKALKAGHLFFEELSETADLDRDKFFEYQGEKYRIINIRSRSLLLVDQTGTKNFVLESVVCEMWD